MNEFSEENIIFLKAVNVYRAMCDDESLRKRELWHEFAIAMYFDFVHDKSPCSVRTSTSDVLLC